MAGQIPNLARLWSFDVTTPAQSIQFGTAEPGTKGVRAVVVIFKADKANGASVLVGGSGPTFPLAAGETHALDIPPGFFIELSECAASGNATSGLIVHVDAVII